MCPKGRYTSRYTGVVLRLVYSLPRIIASLLFCKEYTHLDIPLHVETVTISMGRQTLKKLPLEVIHHFQLSEM